MINLSQVIVIKMQRAISQKMELIQDQVKKWKYEIKGLKMNEKK